MEADRIGLVLAKNSELRSKITSCIRETTSNLKNESGKEEKESGSISDSELSEQFEDEDSLLNIRDALESLEGRLSSLQALQQEQWYDKEAALCEIAYSQQKLLKELKEYKGKELEVIHEAISFASETEDNNDLLLPPYPSGPSLSDNGYIPSFHSTHRLAQNGIRRDHKSDRNQEQSGPLKRVKVLVGSAVKAAVTIVGVITILSLAGFEPRLRKRENEFKLSDLFQLKIGNGKGASIECPPGKVPVMDNGEVRCIVKERVEVPFDSAVTMPDVSYGCG